MCECDDKYWDDSPVLPRTKAEDFVYGLVEGGFTLVLLVLALAIVTGVLGLAVLAYKFLCWSVNL